MFSFFKKNKTSKFTLEGATPVLVDMHSHLLPGIDDGASNIDESMEMLKWFVDMGYKKLVMTPHIMSDFYRNTPEIILEKLELVREEAKNRGFDIALEAAAEYYLDEGLMQKLKDKTPLLTFGDKYLLFETSYMNASAQLDQAVFMMQSQGYKPVLAHPERYTYWFGKFDEIVKIWERGVHLQANLMSLVGYYSPISEKIAKEMIEKKMLSFVSSDCHKPRHLDVLQKVRETSTYAQALHYGLLNNAVLEVPKVVTVS